MLVTICHAPNRRTTAAVQRLLGSGVMAWLDLSSGVFTKMFDDALPHGVRVVDPERWVGGVRERMQQQVPEWLSRVADECGLTRLYIWKRWMSIWWLMPISAMSPFRTPLFHDLHQLLLIDRMLADERPERVHLVSDDPVLLGAVQQVVRQRGIALGHVVRLGRRYSWRRAAVLQGWPRRFYYLVKRLPLLALMRVLRLGQAAVGDSSPRHRQVWLFTMFPALWEPAPQGDQRRDRVFGEWPEELSRHGYEVVYPGILTLGWRELIRHAGRLREQLRHNRILLLESVLGIREHARICLNREWIRQYAVWRRDHQRLSVRFDGIELGSLLLRELDRDIWSNEIPFDLCVAEAVSRLVARGGRPACAMSAFEYQPIERAFTIGLRMADETIPVVGIQTSMCGASHLGFRFAQAQAWRFDTEGPQPLAAALPDYVAALGVVTHRLLRDRLSPARVVLTGPTRAMASGQRIPEERRASLERFCRSHGLPEGVPLVTLATPTMQAESLEMLELTLHAMRRQRDAFLLVKFHSLCPLGQALDRLARRYGVQRYRALTVNILDLLRVSAAAIVGTSSVGVDAIAAGCMPIVYRVPQEYDFSPIGDIEGSVFTFRRVGQLERALWACLKQDEAFEARRARWPEAVERMLYRNDGGGAARLYAFLEGRGVLAHHAGASHQQAGQLATDGIARSTAADTATSSREPSCVSIEERVV